MSKKCSRCGRDMKKTGRIMENSGKKNRDRVPLREWDYEAYRREAAELERLAARYILLGGQINVAG